ncbi:hypothetical protein FWF74_02690 [Candidatus Saccharibacteria bacterium]|nr:hypothetical protein [Candidatus Saccharibacteria bacterium]MCL1962734.1 hypothetical protein [Candidatus Saccharibacteria bacterium]
MKKHYLWLYWAAVTLFWIGVAIVMIGHYINFGAYNIMEYTISRQVGRARWSEILFAAVNVIVGIAIAFFVRKNALRWGLTKRLEKLMYATIIFFFLVSFVPYDPVLGTVVAHRILAGLMMSTAAIFAMIVLVKNHWTRSIINLISGVSLWIIGVITAILFFIFTDTFWDIIFCIETSYVIGFFVFLPTIPAKIELKS